MSQCTIYTAVKRIVLLHLSSSEKSLYAIQRNIVTGKIKGQSIANGVFADIKQTSTTGAYDGKFTYSGTVDGNVVCLSKPYISAEPLDAEILSGIGIIKSEPHDPEEALGNSIDLLDEEDQNLQNEKNWDYLLDQM